MKIKRANKHIYELDAELKAFFKRKPYEVVTHEEPDTGDKVWRVKVHRQPPRRFSPIIGDAIHNLRSALDLLACQLVEDAGGTVTDQTGYPFTRVDSELESTLRSKVQGASKEALRVIRETKPYPGGNETLWRLHRLDIADKHRLIFTVGMAHQAVILGLPPSLIERVGAEAASVKLALRPANRLFPLKDDTEVYRVLNAVRETGHYQDPEFDFAVALGEDEVGEGEPVLATLVEFRDAVQGVIESFAPLLGN